MLVSHEDARLEPEASSRRVLVGVSTLEEALREAGLEGSSIQVSPWAGAEEERRCLLDKLSQHVEAQHLEDYRDKGLDHGSPWPTICVCWSNRWGRAATLV